MVFSSHTPALRNILEREFDRPLLASLEVSKIYGIPLRRDKSAMQ